MSNVTLPLTTPYREDTDGTENEMNTACFCACVIRGDATTLHDHETRCSRREDVWKAIDDHLRHRA